MKLHLKNQENDDKLVALLDLAKKYPNNIQNIQVDPCVRFVYAPKPLVENVVEECCKPTSKSIFSLDTTFNIGPFYVTPTVYSKKGVISNATGNTAIFPGPAMFHEKRTNREFFYFACTLTEICRKFLDIRFVGGDRDGATRSFLTFLFSATFLPCTKHVVDDIIRECKEVLKLSSVAVKYIVDILDQPVRN